TVRAETLTADHGCGAASTQLFKYVVLVFGADPNADLAGANVYDCFTDGTFVDLPPIGGKNAYRLEVFAYNKSAYDQAAATGLEGVVATLARDAHTLAVADAGTGSNLRAAIGTNVALVRGKVATYSTTCTAE